MTRHQRAKRRSARRTEFDLGVLERARPDAEQQARRRASQEPSRRRRRSPILGKELSLLEGALRPGVDREGGGADECDRHKRDGDCGRAREGQLSYRHLQRLGEERTAAKEASNPLLCVRSSGAVEDARVPLDLQPRPGVSARRVSPGARFNATSSPRMARSTSRDRRESQHSLDAVKREPAETKSRLVSSRVGESAVGATHPATVDVKLAVSAASVVRFPAGRGADGERSGRSATVTSGTSARAPGVRSELRRPWRSAQRTVDGVAEQVVVFEDVEATRPGRAGRRSLLRLHGWRGLGRCAWSRRGAR